MNQAGNIIASVGQLWDSAPVAALVPGGLRAGTWRPSDQGSPQPELKRPFAQIVCDPELDGTEWTTGLVYAQDYNVTIKVWSDQAVGDATALQTAMNTLMGANTKLGLLTNNAWTLHISLVPDTLVQSEERLFGQFSFIAGASWQVQLQERRT
jgi:hypothetical protein